MKVNTVFGEEEVPSKVCIKCGEEKPLTKFRVDTSTFTFEKRRPDCKACEKKYREELARVHANNTLPKPDVCECCGEIPKYWTLDHDHENEKPRGWICHKCNLGLSKFGDKDIHASGIEIAVVSPDLL